MCAKIRDINNLPFMFIPRGYPTSPSNDPDLKRYERMKACWIKFYINNKRGEIAERLISNMDKCISTFEKSLNTEIDKDIIKQKRFPPLLFGEFDVFELIEPNLDTGNIRIANVQSANPRSKHTSIFSAKIQYRCKPEIETKEDILHELRLLKNLEETTTRDIINLVIKGDVMLPSDVSRIIDCGFNDDFIFTINQVCGEDLMTLHSSHKKFSSSLVFLITYHSFKALKELHALHIIHRNIQPTSFAIDKPFTLKIKDFYYSSSKDRNVVGRVSRPDKFSSRRAHYLPTPLNEMDDYENWLNVMMSLTCDTPLPWESETDQYGSKRKFYELETSGNHNWFGSADILCLVPYLLKKSKSYRTFQKYMDDVFRSNVLCFDKKEQIKWPPLKTKKGNKKTVVSTVNLKSSTQQESTNALTPQKAKKITAAKKPEVKKVEHEEDP